jgi:outer membrane lipoprotein-sorting protein
VIGAGALVVFAGAPGWASARSGETAPLSQHGGKDEAMMTALLARFAKAPGIFARYKEEKHIALLQAPLVNEGTIHFAPPGRLARHTTKPTPSSLVIDDKKVTFGGAEGSESLDLGTNPVARAFVDSFVMLLAGNRAGLERYFTIGFSSVRGPKAGPDAWHLVLVPRTSPMDKVIKEMTVDGSGLAIKEMVVRETSGDWTRSVFSDVDTNHPYDAAEQARVFRVQK